MNPGGIRTSVLMVAKWCCRRFKVNTTRLSHIIDRKNVLKVQNLGKIVRTSFNSQINNKTFSRLNKDNNPSDERIQILQESCKMKEHLVSIDINPSKKNKS